MRHNIAQQLADYRGVLHWNSYTDGKGIFRPPIDIPMYIKEHPIPIRKPKVSEVTTVSMEEPGSKRDMGVGAIFFGAPDSLQIQLSGWLITPTKVVLGAHYYNIPEYAGFNISYAEVISAYLEGRFYLSSGGAWLRKDPDYYITPYGHKYTYPIISQWEPEYTPVMQKTQFSMTMILEK